MSTDKRWKVQGSKEIFKAGFFRLRMDQCELPDGRICPRYYVMEFANWVNVVPVTTDGQMILVRQYRQAAGELFLEIPGGSADSLTEPPEVAGQRELMEETGYTSQEWVSLGFHYPNPALQNNKMHTYLALGCLKTASQKLDPYEDLEVVTLPIAQVADLLSRGEIKHSLMAASIGLALKPLRERGLLK